MTTNEQIIIEAYKREVGHIVEARGINGAIERYGYGGPFGFLPINVDLVEFLEELFPELK